MIVQAACPSCGAGWDDAPCPVCGCEQAPAPEDLIASWVASPPSEPGEDQDATCLSCGYEGPLVPEPDGDGDGGVCPACGDPWQHRGVLKRVACSECGKVLLLTERHRGRTVFCPGCRSLLGCPLPVRGAREGGRLSILDFLAVTAALALGYCVQTGFWAQRIHWPHLYGGAAVALPIGWTLIGLRALRPRRRRFSPPGIAACVAAAGASLLNAAGAWDLALPHPLRPPGQQDLLLVFARHVVEPLPIAAAVAGTWAALALDRRWRPERTALDRAGRALGLYWIGAGLAVPFLRVWAP